MLSKNELVIMSYLRKSARKNLTSISRETNIPVSTLFDKLKKLEKTIINKHTTLVDFNQLGYNTRANILMKANKKDKNNLGEFLSKNENVNSVFKITNGYDYMIEGIFKTIKDLEEFMEMLEEKYSISKSSVFFVIDELKREEFMADHKLMQFLHPNGK